MYVHSGIRVRYMEMEIRCVDVFGNSPKSVLSTIIINMGPQLFDGGCGGGGGGRHCSEKRSNYW